jgi:hypothetical protein
LTLDFVVALDGGGCQIFSLLFCINFSISIIFVENTYEDVKVEGNICSLLEWKLVSYWYFGVGC